jgi:hypothetical protein
MANLWVAPHVPKALNHFKAGLVRYRQETTSISYGDEMIINNQEIFIQYNKE